MDLNGKQTIPRMLTLEVHLMIFEKHQVIEIIIFILYIKNYLDEMKDYYTNVKMLIEEMFIKSKGKSVILIGHSMGNLHILKLLNEMSQDWKDKYIRSFISISAPFGGSLVSIRCILSGYFF